MKLWIMRALTWLVLRGRLYYVWSKVYQAVFERTRYQIPPFVSLEGVESTVAEMKWRRDTWVMLWDAVSHPGATWMRHLSDKESACGDCDDISLFAAVCIESLVNRGYLPSVRGVYLLSVPWMYRNGEVGGHNVCAVKHIGPRTNEVRWAHISNWNKGEVQRGFKTVLEVVEDVLPTFCESLGWALATTDLRLVRYGKGSGVRRP